MSDDVAVFSDPEAGLRAAVGEAAASVTRLVKLVDGLNGAVQHARRAGLGDDVIADHFSFLSSAPTAVRAALAADGDGTALRFLIASLVAVRAEPPAGARELADRVLHPMGWG